MTGSGCWSARGADWNATRRCATRWRGPTTCSTTPKRRCWTRCSVFAGGFDLESACAVAGSDDLDEYAVLDLLDALVRKSLLIADRSSGRTRFSMLETIRQFAEEQLVARGEADEVADRACPLLRRARSRHHGPVGQPPAARGVRLVHRRAGQSAHRVPVGRRPRRSRRGRHHRHLRGVPRLCGSKQYEPIAWAEELIEPARAVDHPALAFLYVMASRCCMAGRIEAAVRYSEAGQTVLGSGRGKVPYGIEGLLGDAYCVHRPARTDGRVVPCPACARSRHPLRQGNAWSSRW